MEIPQEIAMNLQFMIGGFKDEVQHGLTRHETPRMVS